MKNTRFERARLLGSRVLQIASGAPPLVPTEERDPFVIARREMLEDALPIAVKRPVRKGVEK